MTPERRVHHRADESIVLHFGKEPLLTLFSEKQSKLWIEI
jgi:hypothetical protein